ncbi:MAG: hypothetical protein F9K23_09845 [Bacteroidetes bacterium]|nr:MAG: hypothetical protein F9K23_09845 [Bacteroidota bacterium]
MEQDGNIGVCATSAIWSCLFKTSKLFRNKFPIPHEITSAAGLTYSTDTQPLFPNKGLNTSQIAKILEHYNLTFENIGPKANEKGGVISHAELKKICYSYNKMGIPILLGYKMFNNDTHMVCITGYLSGELNKVATGDGSTSESMAFQHNTIKELYAHNDQFGPYESIDFSVSGNKYQKFINAQQEVLLSFQIEGKNRQSVPIIAIIPLDKKIRVSYSEVYSSVNGFSYLFDLAKDVDRTLNFDFRTFCWDVYLDFSSNFKQQRVQDTSLDVQTRKEISFKPMPKFIWVASLRIQNKLILEFIVDSNSITNSFLIFDMFFYDISFAKRILAFFPSLIDKAVNDNYLGQFRSVRRRKFYNSWLTSTHSRFLRKKLFSL